MKTLAQHLDYLHGIVKQFSLLGVNNLPEIVVVGDQSSGKSSLLQSIIKKDILPHGDKLVTRCPIRVLTSKHQREFATFPDMPGQEFKISEVSQILQAKNLEIEKTKYISDKDILLNLYGPDMLNMTLVDLPGLVKIRLENQPKDIVKTVEQLIKARIKNENTLILAVVSAANDLASSSALAFAKAVDEFGSRTIIVFTMMDRSQNPNSIVQGFELTSELGFLGVVCRSPSQVAENMTIEQQFEHESKFFNEHPIFTNYKDILGMDNLISKIEVEFRKSVFNSLPGIKAEVDARLENTIKAIDNLGEPVPYLENPILFIEGVFKKITSKMKKIIDGNELDIDEQKVDGSTIRENFIEFSEEIENYKVKKNDKSFDKIKNIIKRSRGLEGVSVVSLELLMKTMKMLMLPLSKILVTCLRKIKSQFETLFKSILPIYCRKYKKIFYICETSFEKVVALNEELANERLDILLRLEYETIESDISELNKTEKNYQEEDETENAETDTFFVFIKRMFERSKDNLKYNMPKIIKHFFIRRSLSDLKAHMINLAVLEINNGADLVPEASENEKKRKNYVKARDGLRILKEALEDFKRALI